MIIAHMSEIDQQREMIDRMMYRVNTCVPGVIDFFYPETQTARVIPAIQTRMVKPDGKQTLVDMPAVLSVPICFPFSVGNGYALTIPVKKGDPCVLVFSQRCIDNWYVNGGIQPPEETGVLSRHHDMNDAFAFVCAPPKPDALPDWLENGMEIRNADRTRRVSVHEDGIDVIYDDTHVTLTATKIEVKTPKTSISLESGVQVVGFTTFDKGLDVGGNVKVGTGDSGCFADKVGKVITVQNGIVVSGLS